MSSSATVSGSVPQYTAFLVGGSGVVGFQVLLQLQKSPLCKSIVTLGRKSMLQQVDSINHSKEKISEVIVDNFDEFLQINQQSNQQLKNNENVYKQAFENVDVAFCCLGSTYKKAGSAEVFEKIDKKYPLQIAKFLQQYSKSSLAQFSMLTSSGSNANSWFLYPRVKGQVEEGLKEIYNGTNTRLSIFRPSIFANRGTAPGVSEYLWKESMGVKLSNLLLTWGPQKALSPIKVEDIAKSMLTDWETRYLKQYQQQQQQKQQQDDKIEKLVVIYENLEMKEMVNAE